MNVTFKHPVSAGVALISLLCYPTELASTHSFTDSLIVSIIFAILFWPTFLHAFLATPDPKDEVRPDGKKKDWLDRI